MEGPRWATFDCYGTLVDWNAGIQAELGRPFGSSVTEHMLERYHAIEPQVQETHSHDRGWKLVALTNSDRDLIRLAERAEPAPTRELHDLVGLADALDELVPLAS